MSANDMAEKLARRLRDIMGEFNDDCVGVEILVRQLADYRRAHLAQPAQSVDVEKVREVITRLHEIDRLSDQNPSEFYSFDLDEQADKLTAALQDKTT